MHNDLRFKLWRARGGRTLAFGAILLALILLGWNLATNRLPGLAPEPIALATITPSAPPPESRLRVALIPPANRWYIDSSSNAAQTLRVQVENEGAEAGQFQGAIDASTASCIDLTSASVPMTSINPHQAQSFDLIVRTAGCDGLPILEPFTFRYTWTIPASGHARKAKPRTNAEQNVLLPGNTENSTPVTLNLSIHMPGEHVSSGASAGKPARSWAGFAEISAVTLTTHHAESMHRGLLMLTAIAKDFTWPVLLALVGFFGQDVLARRGERQQILNALLPTVTDLMQNHYLYLARRMQTVAVEAQQIAAPAVPPAPAPIAHIPLRRTFSAILLMRKRILHLTDAKGGIFFRSAIAEDIFAIGISAFYSRFQQATGDADTAEKAAIALRPDDAPHVAYARVFGWQGQPHILTLYAEFAAWAADPTGAVSAEFDEYLTLLDLCQAVLSFECDRVYYQTDLDGKPGVRNWYFDPPQLDFSGQKLGAPKINHLPQLPQGGKQELLRLFTAYLNGIPHECRPGVEYPA